MEPADPNERASQDASASTSSPVGWLPGFALGAVALVLLRIRVPFLVDDAFISFRYARSWTETGTPVFNAFELTPPHVPVEGFSNPLWTALLAGLHGAGADLPAAAPLAQLALALLTLLLVARSAWSLGLGTVGRLGAPLLLATAAPFVAWSQGGMETTLFTALLAALFAGLASKAGGRWTSIAVALGAAGVTLVRVEGIAWVLGITAAVALASRLGDAPGAGRRALVAAASGTLTLLLLLAWRKAVFGEWLPNTVAAKTGIDSSVLTARGLRYLGSWAAVTVTPIAAALTILPALAHRRLEARRTAAAALIVLLGFVLYCLAVGGDWMPFFRFLAPSAPVLAMLLAIGLDRVPRVAGWAAAGTVMALQPLALFDVHVAPQGLRESLRFRAFQGGYKSEAERIETARRNLDYFSTLGRLLARGTEPGDVLAFGAIGSVGWFAPKLDLLDRNGLVTPAVLAAPQGDASTAAGTAGHDKRVPHAWFLDNGEPPARYLFATWVEGAPPALTPDLRARLGQAALAHPKLRGPEEALLAERTDVRIVPVKDEGRTLLLLERRP